MQKLILLLLSPISILMCVNYVKNMPNDLNFIHNNKKLSGVKKGAFSNDFLMKDIKKRTKEMGVTINDLIMAITSISLKAYLIKHGDTKTNKINLAVPFSMRDPTLNPKDFKL